MNRQMNCTSASSADQLLSGLAADYESARNGRFTLPRGGTKIKVPFREAVARDLRGRTDYGILEEATFQQGRSKALLKCAEEAAKRGIVLDWRSVLLALRARIERFSYTVDYMSYFAAVCALFFGIFLALAGTLGPQNYIMATIFAAFGVYSFLKGATLRRRILLYRELLNLIEGNLVGLTALKCASDA